MVKLSNDFHKTVVRLNTTEGKALSQSQIRRARKELCGISDCCCGGDLGERGTQDYEVVSNPRLGGGVGGIALFRKA